MKYCLESVENNSEGKIHIRVSFNQGTANYVNTVCCIDQGKYSNQLHEICLRYIHKQAIANLFLYLCFQLKIINVKMYNLITFLHSKNTFCIKYKIWRLPSRNKITNCYLYRGPLHLSCWWNMTVGFSSRQRLKVS